MQRIKPTDKWNNPVAFIPGQKAVRYPARPPHVVAVNQATADYLVGNGMAVLVDGNNQPIAGHTSQRLEPKVTEPKVTESKVTESKVTESEVKILVLEFIQNSDAKEIAKVKWIGVETAEELKKLGDELTWASLENSLQQRQLESLIKFVNE